MEKFYVISQVFRVLHIKANFCICNKKYNRILPYNLDNILVLVGNTTFFCISKVNGR